MMSEDENVRLDEEKVIRMIKRIYALERENAKTLAYGEEKMKAMIVRIIEEEV